MYEFIVVPYGPLEDSRGGNGENGLFGTFMGRGLLWQVSETFIL